MKRKCHFSLFAFILNDSWGIPNGDKSISADSWKPGLFILQSGRPLHSDFAQAFLRLTKQRQWVKTKKKKWAHRQLVASTLNGSLRGIGARVAATWTAGPTRTSMIEAVLLLHAHERTRVAKDNKGSVIAVKSLSGEWRATLSWFLAPFSIHHVNKCDRYRDWAHANSGGVYCQFLNNLAFFWLPFRSWKAKKNNKNYLLISHVVSDDIS